MIPTSDCMLSYMMSPAVIATVHGFIGRRGGESRGVNHGYRSRSAVVFDSSTLLLGKEDKKKGSGPIDYVSLRGKYGLSVLHTEPEVRMW